jgi:hypothetical protein
MHSRKGEKRERASGKEKETAQRDKRKGKKDRQPWENQKKRREGASGEEKELVQGKVQERGKDASGKGGERERRRKRWKETLKGERAPGKVLNKRGKRRRDSGKMGRRVSAVSQLRWLRCFAFQELAQWLPCFAIYVDFKFSFISSLRAVDAVMSYSMCAL